jgi:hypothetical protein
MLHVVLLGAFRRLVATGCATLAMAGRSVGEGKQKHECLPIVVLSGLIISWCLI